LIDHEQGDIFGMLGKKKGASRQDNKSVHRGAPEKTRPTTEGDQRIKRKGQAKGVERTGTWGKSIYLNMAIFRLKGQEKKRCEKKTPMQSRRQESGGKDGWGPTPSRNISMGGVREQKGGGGKEDKNSPTESEGPGPQTLRDPVLSNLRKSVGRGGETGGNARKYQKETVNGTVLTRGPWQGVISIESGGKEIEGPWRG